MEILPPSPSFIVAIFTLLLFYFTYFLQKTRMSNKKLSVPQPAGAWPLLGHIPILGNLPHITLASMADKYGPIIGIRLGVNPTIVVSNWELAKECLLTNDKAFASRPRAIAMEHLTYNYAMLGFIPYGSYWREVRKISTLHLLSNQRLELFKHMPECEVKESLTEIYKLCLKDNDKSLSVDMKKWFGDLTLNLIVKMIAGSSYSKGSGSSKEKVEWERFKSALRDFFELIVKFVVADAIPFLRWFDLGGHEKKMKKVAKEMDTIIQGWLDDHKRRSKSNQVKADEQDFMGEMLSILEHDDKKRLPYDADTINKATSLGLILAGTDTTTVTLTWALSLLLNNRHVLKKVQDELDIQVGRERIVNTSDLPNLVYLQAIIKETMRLFPAGPLAVPHMLLENCQIEGYHIPAGTRLLVNIWKIHRDPRVWTNPSEFQPERFLTTHKHIDVRGQNFEFIPFGSGRRMCPGISFALLSMQLTLASLLHGFEIETPLDESIDMTESFGLTSIKATPLQVIVTPRLPSDLYQ